jgi:predicted transcriptional regulator
MDKTQAPKCLTHENSAPMVLVMEMPTPDQIAEAALEKGLSIGALCRRADVDAAIFYRWKAGRSSPTMRTIQKMLDAINDAPVVDGEAS